MWEAIKTASHGGKSIRRIFIFALVTIVMSFACLFTFDKPASAIVQPPANRVDSTQTITEDERAAESEPKTECAIDGVGWIVCPITNFLAGGMDWIYEVLTGFLVVQPASNDTDGALYRAWTYMRSFANIAFVIAFLIIIYSQITSFGVSNYGIKRLLPRLIIAAILVNISYYICAVAIDIFNILGYSFQDLFIMMRQGLIGEDVNNVVVPTWQTVTAVVLGGGGALAGITVALSVYELAGLALLLVPALMTCLLAVIVALVVLAARQAIITILVIIAPLAFVAYLLPNTEKWFEKWKSTFMTLLILFPAFSVVFGGAQLASIAIIKNANSIQVVILGLLVQIAPLMITPLLIKFGGGLLGKVSGMVNNPSKGLLDRASNLSRDMLSTRAAKTLNKDIQTGKIQPILRARQKMDYNKRNREASRKTYDGMAESRFMAKRYGSADSDSEILRNEYKSKTMADEASAAKNAVDSGYENYKAGVATDPITGHRLRSEHPLSELARRSERATKNIAISSLASESAKRIQQEQLEKILAPDVPPGGKEIPITEYAVRAAGIDDQRGINRTQAYAKSSLDKRQTDEIATRLIAMDSVTTPSSRIGDAAMFLEKAIKTNNVVDARAAMKMLMTSGAPGKDKLHNVIDKLIPAGDNREVVLSMKSGLLIDGIKSADVTLDRWATNKDEKRDLASFAADIEAYAGLNPEDYAGQTAKVLDSAFKAGAINKSVADSILTGQAATKLNTMQREWFIEISQGRDPGILDGRKPQKP